MYDDTTSDSNSFPRASNDFISWRGFPHAQGAGRQTLYRREVYSRLSGVGRNQRRCQRLSLRLAMQDAAAASAAGTYMTSLNYATPVLTSRTSTMLGTLGHKIKSNKNVKYLFNIRSKTGRSQFSLETKE